MCALSKNLFLNAGLIAASYYRRWLHWFKLCIHQFLWMQGCNWGKSSVFHMVLFSGGTNVLSFLGMPIFSEITQFFAHLFRLRSFANSPSSSWPSLYRSKRMMANTHVLRDHHKIFSHWFLCIITGQLNPHCLRLSATDEIPISKWQGQNPSSVTTTSWLQWLRRLFLNFGC